LSKADKLEKKKNLILARFGWSRRWRAPWDTKWLRWYRMYRGSVPELPEWERDRSPTCIYRIRIQRLIQSGAGY
jgi:hypothetical protein